MVLDRNFEKLIGLQVVDIGINIIPVKKKKRKNPEIQEHIRKNLSKKLKSIGELFHR